MIINSKKSTLSLTRLDDSTTTLYKTLFPFPLQDLQQGIKYMGFQLKVNNYKKRDRSWLVSKLEKILYLWSFHWLSRAGRLTLTKMVLEVIPFYWMCLSWIPKGTLEKIRRLYFRFIWSGMKDHYTLPWAKWELLARPKSLGGWGLKNIFTFAKELAAKSSWRLINTNNIWTHVVTKKYILPRTIEYWIRWSNKTTSNCSIIWKAIIKSFHVIRDGLAWKIRKGEKLRLGSDPWPGSGTAHTLSQELQDHLHAQGLYKISQIVDPSTTDI
jgi:hypothetical protein